jgi:hypothetical protein
MKEVVAYSSFDGKLFGSKKLCSAYENVNELSKAMGIIVSYDMYDKAEMFFKRKFVEESQKSGKPFIPTANPGIGSNR